jgi:hypothetical protein
VKIHDRRRPAPRRGRRSNNKDNTCEREDRQHDPEARHPQRDGAALAPRLCLERSGDAGDPRLSRDVWHFVMMKVAELVVEAKLSENPEQRLAELRQRLGDKIIDQVSGVVGDPDDDEGDDE